MKTLSKLILAVAILVVGSWSARAFSLLGPFKPWQVQAIGYDLAGDIGGPMNLSEAYRWNVPIINYAFDSSFLFYFGSNGVVAVEKAFQILNDLPPAALITTDGNNLLVNGQPVPFDTKRDNADAAVLGLLDVKSHALAVLLEEMGVAQAERYVAALRARETETINDVTYTNYLTIRLNFDPLSYRPTNSVNLVPYGYQIVEPIRPGDYASAIEIPPDLAQAGQIAYSSVSSGRGNPDVEFPQTPGFITSGLFPGQFFTGLTFDDVGALRFLLHTNNVVVENLLPDVTGGAPATGGGGSPWTPFLGTTNFFFVGTNFFFNTNLFGTNNLRVQGLRPGVNKIRFQRVNYDSLLGQLFNPVTNRFLDTTISNARPVIQPVERRITQPDVLFLAADLGILPGPVPALMSRTDTSGWQNNDPINGNANQGGPGVITPQVQISFTDQLPFFFDRTPDPFFGFFTGNIMWGSFDGSDNPPIVFPEYSGFTVPDLRNIAVGQGGGD